MGAFANVNYLYLYMLDFSLSIYVTIIINNEKLSEIKNKYAIAYSVSNL